MTQINLATAKVSELVAYYNTHSGLEPVKGFKNKEVAIQMVQGVIAQMEGAVSEEMQEELKQVREDNASSLVAQLTAAVNGSEKKTSTKNEGVWLNVKILFDKGLGNKEVLAQIHEMYGNSNTTYACIAWYRNKYNKTGSKAAADNTAKLAELEAFSTKYELSHEAMVELYGMWKLEVPVVAEPEVEVDLENDEDIPE
jgi:hypothetical protein